MEAPGGPVPRPYIPPSAAGACAACAAAAVVLQGGWASRALAVPVPWTELLGVLALTAICVILSSAVPARASALRWVAVGLAVGALASGAWLARWHRDAHCADDRPVSGWWLVVVGDPSVNEFGCAFTVELRDDIHGVAIARVRATADEPQEPGACLRAVGRFERLDDSDWARGRFMKGEVGSARIVSIIERAERRVTPLGGIRDSSLRAIDAGAGDARALLAGVICGRTTELSQAASYEAFRACGLTHLVAVSGGHLALIAALLEGALRGLCFGPASRRACLMVVMASYVSFTGGAASAVRSVSMVGLASAAVLGHRRAHALSGLALTVMGLVALDAGVVNDLGFQLSALSVLFMLAFSGYATRVFRLLHVPEAAVEPLALSVVAQWSTLPLTLPLFGEVSLVSPLANIVVGPCMTALLSTGLPCVAVATAVTALAEVLGAGASAVGPVVDAVFLVPDALAAASIVLSRLFAGIPYSHISLSAPWWTGLAMHGAAALLYFRWPTPRPRTVLASAGIACACALAVLFRWAAFQDPSITVLDVGQGDAILIRDGPSTVLVDAGVDDATREALARNHVFHLDAVVVTHWDADHWGGLPGLMRTIPVDGLIVAEGASRGVPGDVRELDVPISEMAAGDILRIGGFTCTAVWPGCAVEGGENPDSLVLAARYESDSGSLSALLTGDTEREELDRYVGAVGDIDVLKMGHHGSSRSVSAAALEVLRPEIAVASAGEGNAYGHPDPESVELVREAGAEFFCTIDRGDIRLTPGATGPRVAVGR